MTGVQTCALPISTDSTHKFEQNKKKNHYNVYTSLKKIKEKLL